MSWKKSLPYFIWQSIRYAKNLDHFVKIWSFRKRWIESFKGGRNSIEDEIPWINLIALEYLQNNLRPGYKVFEYGGGGSTLFFCKNVAEVVTVEHHKDWFEILTKKIREKGYNNWKGFFVEPELITDGRDRSKENPEDFVSGDISLSGFSFEKYVKTIDVFPNDYFDVVLVDGRARPSCIKQSISHVKKNGIVVIDNTERDYYLSYLKSLGLNSFKIENDFYAPVNFTPDFTKTTILRKS